MILAASHGHQAVVEVLLVKGAKSEATNEVNGWCCWAHTHSHWFIVGLYYRSRVKIAVSGGSKCVPHHLVSCVRSAALWCSCYMLPDPRASVDLTATLHTSTEVRP